MSRQDAAGGFRCRWLVSAQFDICFFIGSCLLTFLFFGFYSIAHWFDFVLRGDAILITYFVFTAIFDHPHIFQTFARTHLDAEEFQQRRGLYTWGLLGFITAGFIITALKLEAWLIVVAAIYGTWHIIRQHAGFVKMYKVLNEDLEPLDNRLDFLLFYTGMFACFFHDYGDVQQPIVIYGDLRVNFPSLPGAWGSLLWWLFLGLLILFGLRQTWRVIEGKPINLPKVLLMTAALSTHYFVFFATMTPFLVAEALETVYHDVQYQGWMIHYQRKRFPRVRGLVGRWLGLALLYGIAVGSIEVLGLMQRGWAMWLFVPFTMIVIYHYYVDGLIWRFRDYPSLRKQLFSHHSQSH